MSDVSIQWQEAEVSPGVWVDVCPICGCPVVVELKQRHEDWHNDKPVREDG